MRRQTTNTRTNNPSFSNARVHYPYNDILPPPEYNDILPPPKCNEISHPPKYNEISHPPDYNDISSPPEYNKNEINPSPENNTTDNLTIINEINVRENDGNFYNNISSVTYNNESPSELNK
ncbi:hypothetical protein DMUE_5698 [Dictyocoela muelleri]|nr:hypothetical protein DMUE_5698 [Dictyocoela muelleri]